MLLFRQAGMFGIPLLILTLVILGLTIRGLLGRGGSAGAPLIFWGVVAAVLGLLGQASGLFHALTAIAAAEAIDPRRVSQGFAESFSTSLWGLGLLLAAMIAAALVRILRRGDRFTDTRTS